MEVIDLSNPGTRDKKSPAQKKQFYDEIPTAIFINGKHAATVLLAPGDQEEYVTGFLITELYISNIDEIESIRAEKNRISVLTTNIFTSPGPKKTILSGCSGAVSYVDPGKLPMISESYSLHVNDLKSCVTNVKTSISNPVLCPVFAFLCTGPDIILKRFDIGDDQVTDRMIGAALTGSIDFSHAYCICSATITSEIVRKCLMVKIPLLLTTRHLTGLAQEIGQKNGMCIAGIHDEQVLVYSHPERIIR